jgi:hypothetical protein
MQAENSSLLFPAMAVAIAVFTCPVQGAMLVGANDPTVDVPGLQEAADAGGHWVLSGTFDLGDLGRVVLSKDVTFEGEVGANGEPATIKGGDWAFLSPLPFSTVISAAQTPFAVPAITAPGPRIVVRNLVFDGPIGAAIHIAYSSHLEVTGNTIRNVHRRQLTPSYARHAGIDVGTQTYLLGELRAPQTGAEYFHLIPPRRRQNTFIPGAINGEVIITSNGIEVDPPGIEPIEKRSFGFGVLLNFLDGAMVRVSENTIKGASRTGIEVWDPRYGPTGTGAFVLEQNFIATPSLGSHAGGVTAPNGILVGWVINPHGGTDAAMNVPPVIRRNRIEMNSVSELFSGYQTAAAGITNVTDRTVIEHNEIRTNDPSHMGITVLNSHALIRANTVQGAKGLVALRAATTWLLVQVPDRTPDTWVETIADGNAFIGNKIGGFTADRSIFPLASSIIVLNGTDLASRKPRKNTFVGSGGQKATVTDFGVGTQITGYMPVSGGVGDVLHEVLGEPFPFKLK